MLGELIGAVALTAAEARPALLPPYRNPDDYDYLVVAEDDAGGGVLAMLGADLRGEWGEEYLFLDIVLVTPELSGRRMLRRLVATALMQAARSGPVPRAIAVRCHNPLVYRAMRRLARDFGAILYPELDDRIAQLGTVALARRIAGEICPASRFDAAHFVLPGARVIYGRAWDAMRLPALQPEIDALYARRLGPADQFLLLLDLRHLSAEAVVSIARRLRRGRSYS